MTSNDPTRTSGKAHMLGDALSSTLFDPRYDEAQALADEGRTIDALGTYGRIGVGQGERHLQDALVLEQRGDVQGAAASLKKAVAANPGSRRAWIRLANLLDGADAEKAFREVLKFERQDVPHINSI